MTFDEALKILEMSSRENPDAARRAYLLQLQKNGPEVPPDLYATFTAAYEVLKAPEAWGKPSLEEDSLVELKREAESRRQRGRSREKQDARIIDPTRVPQRNQNRAETRIIDPSRVPQRKSGNASAEPEEPAEAPRIRRRQQDARQAAATDILGSTPQSPERSAPVASSHSDSVLGSDPDPFTQYSEPDATSDPLQAEAPTVIESAAHYEEDDTLVEPSPPVTPQSQETSSDPFADLLAADAAPTPHRPKLDLTLGGEMEVHTDPTEVIGTPDASEAPQPTPDGKLEFNSDPLAAVSPVPRKPAAREEPKPAPRRSRGRPGSKAKPKALDDASLAIFSKLVRTYSEVIEFAALVTSLEENPDDAIGEMALNLFNSGERVAATDLLVAGFDCMEGKPTRRWIEVRGCLEILLKLTEAASEDHTAHECSQTIRRALNRWRAETEDPRIVFQEATLLRWSWLNELTQLPQGLPKIVRTELTHAIRAGDLEEAVLPLGTYASRNQEEMARLKPVLEKGAPKIWSILEPMLREKPKAKPERKGSGDAASGESKRGGRRRRQRKGGSKSKGLPTWAWGLFVVAVVGVVFSMVAQMAVQQETEDDEVQVAADGLCKVVGGNKPACLEARRVVRALREQDCETLSAGLIQDFAKAVQAANQLRGAMDTGAADSSNLARHEGVLLDMFYDVCQGAAQ